MERDSFVFYRSFFEAIEHLETMEQLEVYRAISDYSLNGNEPQLEGAALAIWILIKPQLDANWRKYENGKNGGRRKQEESKLKPNRKQTETKEETKEKQEEYKKVVELWNELGLQRVEKLTESRKRRIKLRLKEMGSMEVYENVLRMIRDSPFLMGRKTDWKASFDWLFSNDKNWLKINEGNYAENRRTDTEDRRQWLASQAAEAFGDI